MAQWPAVGESGPERLARRMRAQARRSAAMLTAAGVAVMFGLLPLSAWAPALAFSVILFFLAFRHPFREVGGEVRTSRWVAGVISALSLVLAMATGGLSSVEVPVYLAVFAVSAMTFEPPGPLVAAVVSAVALSVPELVAGTPLGRWRLALGVTSALGALGYFGPLANRAWNNGLRTSRLLRAAADIGRAMASLNLDAVLPVVAERVGAALQAYTTAVVVGRADPSQSASWAADTSPGAAAADLKAVARQAIAGGNPLVRPLGGQWNTLTDGSALPPAVTALAVPFSSYDDAAAGAIVACAPLGGVFPPDALGTLRDLADYTAMGVRAATLHAQSRQQAFIDPITHLYNARYLERRLEEEVSGARRRGQPLSLLFIDSDALKSTNDRYGHQHGDRLVRQLAQLISQHVRADDVPVRYAGGDEFIVILPATDWPEAAETAERLRRMARDIPIGPHGEASGSVSIGIATFPSHARGAAELIARADQAMYQAKSAGKDRVVVFGVGTQAQTGPWAEG